VSLIHAEERTAVASVAALIDCNPFLPDRVALEQSILGATFVAGAPIWHADGDNLITNPNLDALRERVEALADILHRRLRTGVVPTVEERDDYVGVVLYLLWLRYEDEWYTLTGAEAPVDTKEPVAFYPRFESDVGRYLDPLAVGPTPSVPHLFALGFQVRRAFHHIFRKIFGASPPAARLRASVWQSIFTGNMRRYRSALFDRMRDIPTLITGESGTGKELVARAIALSQYIPFDPKSKTFVADPSAGFSAVNLSALSPTLVESELFGHRRGAFTGAIDERSGWFEKCGAHGAVFVDEIGELDTTIQVKLLRVLQSREYQKLGTTESLSFRGKVVAATNRDLHTAMESGRFRDDLYYRICADLITTPTLRQQLSEAPADLDSLLLIVARRVAGDAEGGALAEQTRQWIVDRLGADYPWPGNMRELEQCVRNVMVHGEYHPPPPRRQADAADDLAAELRSGRLTADEIVERYCHVVYAQTDSARETARRLGRDPRTVRAMLHARRRR